MLPKILIDIAQDIYNKGGRAYLVGGAVLELLESTKDKSSLVKDFDIEVFGLRLEDLHRLLCLYGKVDEVGSHFGVLKATLPTIKEAVDFSLPRKETKSGILHTEFLIDIDHEMDVKDAMRRRDLTINAVYYDIIKEQFVDYYKGIDDYWNGILRVVSPLTFKEDPLRVLRIMQLLPRKAKTVDPGTIELCREMFMHGESQNISRERIFEEFNKLLLKAVTPSIGLKFLAESYWIKMFPELDRLIGCKQSPKWHREGDAWNHTLLVVDYAAGTLRRNIPEEWKLAFMYAALLHDIGKPDTTDPETFSAHGHEVIGETMVYDFMQKLTNNKDLMLKTATLVRYHMAPINLYENSAGNPAWRRLHNKVDLMILSRIIEADNFGKGRSYSECLPILEKCWNVYNKYDYKPIPQILTGKILIKLGYEPGPKFKTLLADAYELQMHREESSWFILWWKSCNESFWDKMKRLYQYITYNGDSKKNKKKK